MPRHVFDMKERANHELVAAQLHALADQIATGRLEIAYDDFARPTDIGDPIDLVIDLMQHKHDCELSIAMRWSTDEA